jgi:hypothetical protein
MGDVGFLDWGLLVDVQHDGAMSSIYPNMRGHVYEHVRWPWSSVLEKQLSVILLRSSSNRSARDMPEGVELVAEGAPLEPPAGGRLAGARGSPAPLV